MRTLLAAVSLSILSGTAFAGEGQGNPFPFTAAPAVVSMQGYKQLPSTSQNPFPFTPPGTVMSGSPVLPTAGSDGVVQTANSLPRGFEDGVSGGSLNRNAPTPTLLAQPRTVTPQTRG